MKRYASIDFLRGLAIFLMVFVHTLMRWVWRDPIYSDMGSYSLFAIIFLLAALFLGGWCGLFLMVSATGNMISMHNSLERNPKIITTVYRQIIGGLLLLFAAVLTESITGYGAYFGDLALGHPEKWPEILYRGFHFETIHTVAWAVILNGITQGILSINGGWRKINRNITIYIILAVLIVVLTPSVWKLVQKIIPGYPYQSRIFSYDIFGHTINVDNGVQYGYLGYDSIWHLTLLFFLDPLAGSVEPIFPFLAVSYIGSIIGLLLIRKQKEMDGFEEYDVSPMKNPSIWLKRIVQFLFFASLISFIIFAALWQFSTIGENFQFMQIMIGSFMVFALLGIILYYFRRKEKETSDYKRHTLPVKIGLLIGFALFVIGLIGSVLVVFTGDPTAIDVLLGHTYDVRKLWETGTWLWWFCVVTGAQIGAFSLLLRVTEFRGKTRKFGQKTLYFRRFGVVAFSIYNYQFIDVIPALFLTAIGTFIPIVDPGSKTGFIFPGFGLNQYGVYGIWFLLGLIFLMYWLVLWLWQKVSFVGGFEWFLGKGANLLIPSKRSVKGVGKLNVQKGLVDPDWIDIITEENIPRQELVDSKLSFKLSWLGLIIAPISLISLGIARTARNKEGKNIFNSIGLIISIVGALLSVVILVGGMFIYGVSF
jgi:hypothetical protein